MKIEMAESLIRSWARHCIGCQVAELNWKPSTENTWPKKETSSASLFAEATEFFQKALGMEIFKKNVSVDQLIKQAEIDVLGLKIENGQVRKIVAVDVAFHSGGLLYGDKQETAARVAKKLFRSAIIADTYFAGVEAEIMFAAPKVTPASAKCLKVAEKALNDFFATKRGSLSFKIIINEDFASELLQPVVALKESVADTSELFLRSYQLLSMFENTKPSTTKETRPIKISPQQYCTVSEEEIKKVKRRVPRWFKNPGQINSRILLIFLELRKNKILISPDILRKSCSGITDFYGNYNQMKNFGQQNHAKVFEEKNGIITLWSPVEDFICETFGQFQN